MSEIQDTWGDTITIEAAGNAALVAFEMGQTPALMMLEAPALREFIKELTTTLAKIEGRVSKM